MGVKLELKNIKKIFGKNIVLSDVNLTINPGESFVILGGSGGGKSVTLKIIATLLDTDEGEVLMNSKQVCSSSTTKPQKIIRNKVGFLFQEIGLFDYLTVWENVAFYHLYKLRIKRKDAKNLAIEYLQKVGIKESIANLYPNDISLGTQKRVGLARVLIKRPDLILIDEPTSGLDPILSCVISKLIRDRAKELDATVVTITHEIDSARIIGDRIGLLHNGKFIWTGTIQEFEKTDNESVRQFADGQIDGPIKFV